MLDNYTFVNLSDENGNPTGGYVDGIGLAVTWQNGPLGRGADRKEPNGAFIETVIDAVCTRLEFYQESKFACVENTSVLNLLRTALEILNARTKEREGRDVEGTHQP